MSKSFKFLFIACAFFGIAIGLVAPYIHESKYLNAEGLEFEGVVEHIEWKSKNHAQPLFIVKNQIGTIHRFNDGELNIKKDQLKVGDSISKKTGSRYCNLNGLKTECVKEFISFHDLLFNSRKAGT